MKKFVIFLILIGASAISYAQKFGYVDTEYILNQIPEYKAAEAELNKVSADWQKEIDAKYAEIDKLYKAYQAEKIFLTEEMMKKRENEIVNREREVKDLQKQRFGVDGELFKKRMELIKPIQDKVYGGVKSLAEKKGLHVIFDKSSDLTMLYTSPRYDFSDDVLSLLGYNKK